MEWQDEVLPARRLSGLAVVPNSALTTLSDPLKVGATLDRWAPVLSELGIEILGVRDVPTQPVRLTVDGIEWEIKRIGEGTYQVPPSVYHVILAAEEHNVPFAYYLWGEEQFVRPHFVPDRSGSQRTTPSRRSESWGQRWSRRIDPILIGVIPTAPNRGVWGKLGAGFHLLMGPSGAMHSGLLVSMGKPSFRPDPSLEEVIRRTRVDPPAHQPRSTPAKGPAPPGGGFWTVWCVGTFGPILAWFLLASAGARGNGIAWLFWIGVALVVTNCWFALGTNGYMEGSGADFGYGCALLVGWLVILAVAAVVAIFVAIAWGVITSGRK